LHGSCARQHCAGSCERNRLRPPACASERGSCALKRFILFLDSSREAIDREDPTMLRAGQPAPQFTLPDADMEMVNLADYRDRNNVVLYFYPKDDTPGCTREAIDFSDLENEFAELHTVVLGVSRDDCLSH